MAKSSYEYAAAALARPESAERADARAAVVGAFGDSGGAYGYRRIAAQTGIGEWTVRAIMGEESLVASGRMLPAQGGRAPHGAQRPGLPLSLARVDRDMRRPRHREVDVEEGLQPGQRARRGLLRKA